MPFFERFLSVWVGLAIVAGVALGLAVPGLFQAVAAFEVAHVNLAVAVFIWVMIYPMMIQIDFAAMKRVGDKPKGLLLTLVVNWLIKPFTMAALGWLFFKVLFADMVDPQTGSEYIAGMILLGVAPCTAMVFVWSHLTKGDANYTLVLSTVLYVLLPLVAGALTRRWLSGRGGEKAVDDFVHTLKPVSILGLLATVVLLFGFQAETILAKPQAIVLIAIPLLIQTYGIFLVAFVAARWLRLPHNVAGPACLIGTSNFFELAVAVAISLFGLSSGAALATVVGVLVEVPVMLSLVAIVNRTKHWFEDGGEQ